MAKNKDNRMKNSSKNSSSAKNTHTGSSAKDSVAQFPDNRPSRSGPGGE